MRSEVALNPSSIGLEQIARVDFLFHVGKGGAAAVADDDVGFLFEGFEVADDAGAEEFFFFQCGLVDDDFDALGLDPLHDALDARASEIVRS